MPRKINEKTKLLADVEPISTLNIFETTNFSTTQSLENTKKKEEKSKGVISTVIDIDVDNTILTQDKTKFSNKKNENLTLLEKALAYRQQNPEKWEARKKEIQTRLNHSSEIYEDNLFLEKYYKRLAEIENTVSEKPIKKYDFL